MWTADLDSLVLTDVLDMSVGQCVQLQRLGVVSQLCRDELPQDNLTREENPRS